MPTERAIKNSDGKKKSDLKSGTSNDKITYKAEDLHAVSDDVFAQALKRLRQQTFLYTPILF